MSGVPTEKDLEPFDGHIGVWSDDQRVKANEASGKPLCEHCGGSGNEFLFMYRACPKCAGTGLEPCPAGCTEQR